MSQSVGAPTATYRPVRLVALALAALSVLGMGKVWGHDDPGPSCSVEVQTTERNP